MNARIYGLCEVCQSPVRIPRRTFHIMAKHRADMRLRFMCRNWLQHPAVAPA